MRICVCRCVYAYFTVCAGMCASVGMSTTSRGSHHCPGSKIISIKHQNTRQYVYGFKPEDMKKKKDFIKDFGAIIISIINSLH